MRFDKFTSTIAQDPMCRIQWHRLFFSCGEATDRIIRCTAKDWDGKNNLSKHTRIPKRKKGLKTILVLLQDEKKQPNPKDFSTSEWGAETNPVLESDVDMGNCRLSPPFIAHQ